MNDHQQITAERGRRAADLRAAAVALLEQQSIAAGVMLDLDSDQVVAAGPKSALLSLLSNGAPATASGDELAKWHEPSWQKGYSAGYNDAVGDVRAPSTSTSPAERAASSAGGPGDGAPKFPEPGYSNSLADRVFNLPCNWKGDQALHSAILMGHTMACEQAYNLVMADEQARAAVSAATKPTADLSSLQRYEGSASGIGEQNDIVPCDDGSYVLFSDVQSLLATKPAASAAVPEGFAEWLAREMPAGTVINDPAWWAPRIVRALAATPAASTTGAAQTAEQVRDQAMKVAISALERIEREPGCGCSFPCCCKGPERDAIELSARMDIAAEALTAIRALKRPTPTHSSEAGDAAGGEGAAS